MWFSFLISICYRFQSRDILCCVETYLTLLEKGCLPFLFMKANVNLKSLKVGTYPKHPYGIKS